MKEAGPHGPREEEEEEDEEEEEEDDDDDDEEQAMKLRGVRECSYEQS